MPRPTMRVAERPPPATRSASHASSRRPSTCAHSPDRELTTKRIGWAEKQRSGLTRECQSGPPSRRRWGLPRARGLARACGPRELGQDLLHCGSACRPHVDPLPQPCRSPCPYRRQVRISGGPHAIQPASQRRCRFRFAPRDREPPRTAFHRVLLQLIYRSWRRHRRGAERDAGGESRRLPARTKARGQGLPAPLTRSSRGRSVPWPTAGAPRGTHPPRQCSIDRREAPPTDGAVRRSSGSTSGSFPISSTSRSRD